MWQNRSQQTTKYISYAVLYGKPANGQKTGVNPIICHFSKKAKLQNVKTVRGPGEGKRGGWSENGEKNNNDSRQDYRLIESDFSIAL